MVQRLGLGRVRHLDIEDLWVQEAEKLGLVAFRKIGGEVNPADALTKAVTADVLWRMTEALKMRKEKGRPDAAPKMRQR